MRRWPSNLKCSARLVATLVSAVPGAAWAQDADFDAVADAVDAFPCDWRRSAASFTPSEHGMATLMLEDNWPAQGDLDFNDAVVLHNLAAFHDASGRVTALRLTVVPRALGARLHSGLALALPIPRESIRSITRTTGGAAESLTPRASDATLVVTIAADLRAHFGGATGWLNTAPGGPSLGDAAPIVVDIELASPVSLSLASDPLDLFFFRADDPSHEIHRPMFRGTAAMDTALFGTLDDGTTAARAFVDRDGLPFVLSIPVAVAWPLEGERVEALWPDITRFAASAGAEARGFYASTVIGAKAYAAPAAGSAPPVGYAACLAPTCGDGARNGQESDVDCGGTCGGCALDRACRSHADCLGGGCSAGTCVAVIEEACTLDHGEGVRTRAGTTVGPCVATRCEAGYHLESGACPSDVRSCTAPNGTGTQTWRGTTWGPCDVVLGVPAGSSCHTLWTASGGSATSGMYSIDPDGPGAGSAFNVWCDMRSDGGWEVLQHDGQTSLRGARGTPSAAPGWSLDYVTPGAPLRDLRMDAFSFEVSGGGRRVFDGLTSYGTAARPTVYGMFGGVHNDGWECRSDAPSASCAFTTADGRHWGRWESTSSCCLGGGGFWFYSRVGNSAENWGICANGRPNGAGYSGTTTGCSAGASTPISPAGSVDFRIAVRVYVAPRADGTSCRTILDSGQSRGDGVYFIDPDGLSGADPIAVWCDMTSDGGGWIVVHDDTHAQARRPRGRPASTTGWNVDYLTAASPLRNLEIQDFRMEIPGAWSQTWRDVARYGTTAAITPPALFSGGHVIGWRCNSDAPTSDCYFTTRGDGRHWGLWDGTYGCCIGQATGGFWFYSSTSQGAANYGMCDDGFPNGAAYAPLQSGCEGAGLYTPVTPASSRRYRIMFREPSAGTPLNAATSARASCRHVLDAGESQGSGLYWIQAGTGAPSVAYCDMTTDGGGWTALFAGRNGSANVFDHFDQGAYSGVCPDPSRRCLRRLPPSVATAGSEVMVMHGTSAVSMPMTSALRAYLANGTQGGWSTISASDLGTGPVVHLPDNAWLGSGTNTGLIFARAQSSAQVLASSYDFGGTWNMGNGVANDQTPWRLFYREGGRPADPVHNAQAAARSSCRAILDAGESRGSGLYWLRQGAGAAYQAWCDMQLDGGGWTTFFATLNGSPNVIDRLDSGYHAGVCTDPRRRCVRRVPSTIPQASTEVAVVVADAAVSIPTTPALHAWAVNGTQGGWLPVTSASIGSGAVGALPDSFWSGTGTNRSWIATRGQAAASMFAGSYGENGSWDVANLRANTFTPIRLMYREGGPIVVPGAFTSCRAARNAGSTTDGVYTLQQPGGRAYSAYCDQTTDGGGWTAVLSGANGVANVFDWFDAGAYNGTCSDPATRCLRRMPSSVPSTGTQIAVRCGNAMVRAPMSAALRAYLVTGTQASWVPFAGAVSIGSAPVANLPDTFWTGSGTNYGFVVSRGTTAGPLAFASGYSGHASWDRCNGVADATSRLRVFYREP